jgi:hypothetical protein
MDQVEPCWAACKWQDLPVVAHSNGLDIIEKKFKTNMFSSIKKKIQD